MRSTARRLMMMMIAVVQATTFFRRANLGSGRNTYIREQKKSPHKAESPSISQTSQGASRAKLTAICSAKRTCSRKRKKGKKTFPSPRGFVLRRTSAAYCNRFEPPAPIQYLGREGYPHVQLHTGVCSHPCWTNIPTHENRLQYSVLSNLSANGTCFLARHEGGNVSGTLRTSQAAPLLLRAELLL